MTENGDDRSPMSKALATASQITTIGLTMILPALIGYFIDQWAGTVLLFVVLGLIFGVASAILQLSKLVAQLNRASQILNSPQSKDDGGPSEHDG